MAEIGWIAPGPIAGFVAGRIVDKHGERVVLDVVPGIVGGRLPAAFGAAGVTGFDLYGMVAAVIGAVVVLVVHHLGTGRRAVT